MVPYLNKGKDILRDTRRTIFLVDRSDSFLMYLRILLERMGFRVVPLKKGGLLKDLMQVVKPDLVLLGTILEDMEGLSLLRDIKKDDLYSQIPVVIICNPEDEDIVRDNRELEHTAYLSRPVNIFRLYSVVYDTIVFSSKEKRTHLRTSFREQVKITHNEKIAKYWATNLSEGGIYLRSRIPISVNEEVVVEIPLGFETPAKIRGKVIYTKQSVSDSGTGEPGLAVRFLSLSSEQASQLRICILGLLVGDLLEEQDEPILSLVSRTNELYEEIVLEHIRVGQELKSYQLQLKNIVEALPMGILTYSLDSNGELSILSSNPAVERLLGVSARQIHGNEIKGPNLEKLGFLDELKHVCTDGGTFERINVKYHDEKVDRVFDFLAFQPSPGKVALVLNDATSRKKLEEEGLRLQKLESVGLLAGGIAHDFNNLLQGVFGSISLARIFSAKDRKVYQLLSDAEKALALSRNLTKQLLTFSQGGDLSKRVLSLSSVIQDSVKFALSGSNIDYKFSIEDTLRPVEADEGQISQVIQNIVLNAHDAMPDGGIVRINARNMFIDQNNILSLIKGNYVVIEVEDSGVGIPEPHIQKIFDPYFTTKQKGSGLGLATSYSIIKKHGGLLDVKSEPEAGSTFSIYLPASDQELPLQETDREVVLYGKGKILLMDDSEIVLIATRKMLEALGYKAEVAENGEQAVEKYTSAIKSGKPFDVVILDLTIRGGMGGLDVIKKLTEIDPVIRAIVSSGYAEDPIIANYEYYGFKALLSKPYEIEELSKTLKSIINEIK